MNLDLISIGLISVGVIAIIIAFFLFIKKDDSKDKKGSGTSTVPNVAPAMPSSAKPTNPKQVVGKNDKNLPRKDIFDFMEFEKISDNMIIQNKGNRFTMVIQCKGINYDLMSDVEQMAVEEGFITFLNTLKFPIQLYVQASTVDLKKSMSIYKNSVEELQNQFSEADDAYRNESNNLDGDFIKIREARERRDKVNHILEYAQDITRYVERISLNKNMLQRKFYVILSYNKSDVSSTLEFNKDELYNICQRELMTRAQTLISSLSSCSIQGKILNSNEIAELLYISYNRDDEKLLDVRTALDSGFYRLYSTSKDVFQKKEEMLQKQIEEEALNRVKEALRQNMNVNVDMTPEEQKEDFEEKTDREALSIINEANIPDVEKEQLADIIAENHVAGVEQRKIERKIRKEIEEEKERKINEAKEEDMINIQKKKNEEKNENQNTDTESSVDDMIV